MKRLVVALACGGIALATATPTASAQTQEEPEPVAAFDLEINYEFLDQETETAFEASEAAKGELFDTGGVDQADLCVRNNTGIGSGPTQIASFRLTCDFLPVGTYTVGVDSIDDYFVTNVFCFEDEQGELPDELIDDPGASFTASEPGEFWVCNVALRAIPILYIDKIVNGGPLGASDFPLEIYDDAQDLVATVDPDPSDQLCEFEQRQDVLNRASDAQQRMVDDSLCATVRLLPGTYTLGEILPDYGYVERSLDCEYQFDGWFQEFDERALASPEFDVAHSVRFGEEELFIEESLCRLTNDFVTVDVTADLVVINDDGGEAQASEFTIEVYDSFGTLVDEGVDPDPLEGNALVDFVLPIGDYTFGVRGPEGYTASAVVNVTPQEATEIIPTGADFTAAIDQDVAGIITVDDPPAEPAPTTVAPTTVPPTTAAPTTAAPSTAAPTTAAPSTAAPTTAVPTTLAPGAAPSAPPTTITMILPETGSSSGQTGTILLMAIGALLLGGGAVLATRRS